MAMSKVAKKPICRIEKISAVNPRKRFDVILFPNHLLLNGKTVNLNVDYSNIKQISVLPRNVVVSVVLSVLKPIDDGKKEYSHIVFQFELKRNLQVFINLTRRRRMELTLNLVESGTAWKTFSEVVSKISSADLQHPQVHCANSRDGAAVDTSLGREDGHLFLLQSCCLFVNRPITYISYTDIDSIQFHRLQFCTYFDIEFIVRVGEGEELKSIMFSNIEKKSQFERIFKFLYDTKTLSVVNGEALARGDFKLTGEEKEDNQELSGSDNESYAPSKSDAGDVSGDDDRVIEVDEGDKSVKVGEKRKADTLTRYTMGKFRARRPSKRVKPNPEEVINLDSSDDDDDFNPENKNSKKAQATEVIDLESEDDEFVPVPLHSTEHEVLKGAEAEEKKPLPRRRRRDSSL